MQNNDFIKSINDSVLKVFRDYFTGVSEEELQVFINDLNEQIQKETIVNILEKIEIEDKTADKSIYSKAMKSIEEFSVESLIIIQDICIDLKIDIDKIAEYVAKEVLEDVLGSGI